MEEFDTLSPLNSALDDEQLMMNEVICGDAELFYMDCYFRELFLYKEELTNRSSHLIILGWSDKFVGQPLSFSG